jgi:hypothetical protein
MRKLLGLIVLSIFVDQGSAMDKIYLPAEKILLRGMNANKEVVKNILPKEFFIENRNGVVVKEIKKNLLYVHNKKVKEKEFFLEKHHYNNQFGLFHKENNKIIDRRIKIDNVFDTQYKPICLLRGTYRINDDHNGKLVFYGSGFRNILNQVVTAGHNLYLNNEDIEQFCNEEKIALKKYDFDINLLTIDSLFGLSDEKNHLVYTHLSSVNGKDCFVDKNRDFGFINLPIYHKNILDDNIGSMPMAFIPDQPHEYTDKNITIIGYPGEKTPKSLWYHYGPIKYMDSDKVTTYDVDTTPGNSGSPGFFESISRRESKDINDFPTHLVHTHSDNPFNAGQGFDKDILDFLQKNKGN